ncbi:MAG: hypothetical protein Q8R42_02635 [Desulfocapsaceae bacterium]|nr:hypothetical protein [Desulfocapsaceae bacterium]
MIFSQEFQAGGGEFIPPPVRWLRLGPEFVTTNKKQNNQADPYGVINAQTAAKEKP